ncbi:MAG TPA: hypothetical protein VGC42_27350 [Kofleriaceae bacterium]
MITAIADLFIFASIVHLFLALGALHATTHKGFQTIMSALDDLKTQYTDLKTKADALVDFAAQQVTSIATLNARISDLETQIAGGTVDEQALLRAVIDDMRAETSKMAAAVPSIAELGPVAK